MVLVVWVWEGDVSQVRIGIARYYEERAVPDQAIPCHRSPPSPAFPSL
jgi:hypothetical protein